MSATQTQSLFGCTAVVTGVSPGGIGVHTAIGLCKAGARVVLASRDRAKAEAAAGLIRSAVKPAAIVDVMQLDLASLASIRQFVAEFEARYDDLTILVNNAGVYAVGSDQRTEEGFDLTYGVNFIGAYYLTMLLLPIVRRSAPSRIINVSSQVHRQGVLAELKDAPFASTDRGSYRNSKLAMVLFTYDLQKRLRDEGVDVKVFAVSPGAVATEIWRWMPRCLRIPFDLFTKLAFLSPEQGAQTSLFAALKEPLSGGLYFSPYMGTRSAPEIFDYWSVYGEPRICLSSPDSYSVKAGRDLIRDTEAVLASGLNKRS